MTLLAISPRQHDPGQPSIEAIESQPPPHEPPALPLSTADAGRADGWKATIWPWRSGLTISQREAWVVSRWSKLPLRSSPEALTHTRCRGASGRYV